MVQLAFADVVVDLDAMQIERGGEVVPIEPQVFDVLAHLIRNRDRLVPRVELLDAVWGDRFVSDSALSSRIKSARRAIGDNGRDQRLIRTVHGRGFRFVGEVHDAAPLPSAPAPAGGAGRRITDGGGAPSEVLREVVARVAAGEGAAVQVVGGSGASRADALDELAALARDRDLLVGRGGAQFQQRRYGPVLDALDEWLQRRPDLADRIPAACIEELAERARGGAGHGRQRLFVAAQELLVVAAEQGAVLLVDDLHLIDRSSQALLVHLARATRRHGAAVVVSHRSDWDLGRPLVTVTLPTAADPAPDRVPAHLLDALRRVAVLGPTCTDDEVRVAVDGHADTAQLREAALASQLLRVVDGGWTWIGDDHATLAAALPEAERAAVARAVADHLEAVGAEPERIVPLRRAAGQVDAAERLLVAAVERAAAGQEHATVLRLTEDADQVRDPAARATLLGLRGEVRCAAGEPDAIRCYREALRSAVPEQVPWLRARLARTCLFNGDLDGAAEAMDGVTPDGGPFDGGILLVGGMLAYFQGDLETAQELVDAARPLALAPGSPAFMLDVIALDGMIAHSKGEWFDRLRRELRADHRSPEVAGTVFDSHVCVAQYLLYGPTGHDEVKALASGLLDSANESGSRRAVGFALTLLGEAELLSGDLDQARVHLGLSVAMHRELGADTGLAHALQRLAEVELEAGDRPEAERLCRQAIPLARFSPLSRHLLQRIYGTLIAAAPDADAAVDVVDEAAAALDYATSCEFCEVMVAVPAARACATVGRHEEAEHHLARASACAARWEGPAWPAAVAEARAVLAVAQGRVDDARVELAAAIRGFDLAGQVLDAARCREALDDL